MQGRDGRAGYRYPLWFMLQDAGFDVFSLDLSGLIELQRIAGDNIAACEMLNDQQ